MALSQTLPGTTQTDLVTFTLKINDEAITTRYRVTSILISKEVNKNIMNLKVCLLSK